MIVISLVLVVISAISLLVGGLFRDDLVLIWVSIGAALAAALFLALGVLRGTRRRKPTKAATLPGDDAAGKPATWQGAGWTGAAPADGLAREEEVATFVEGAAPSPSADATTRLDDAAFAPPRPAAAEETTRLDNPQPEAPATAAPSAPAPQPAPPKPPPSAPAGGWAPPAPPKPATPPPPVPPPPGG